MLHLILIYAGISASTVILAAASGIVAKSFYLAGCLGLCVWTSRRNSWDYLLLTLWITALTPLIRRLIDQQAGWDATNVVLTAPYVIALPMLPSVMQRIGMVEKESVLFPGIAGLCLFYGFVVSLMKGNLTPAVIGSADWGIPLLYYFFILVHGDRLPDLLNRLPQFVAINMLLLGGYGIWQFVNPPGWDQLWMKSAEVGAFGIPEPYMVRVFSTLNSAGPFSCWMMVLIVLSFGFKSRLTPIARLAGVMALVFTTVRTSWGGLAIALLIIILSSGRKATKSALGAIFAIIAVGSLITAFPDINDVISARIATFGDLKDDGSLLERQDISSRMLGLIADTPLGVGLGTLGRGVIADPTQGVFTGPIDNGVLEILGSLGWLSGVVYLIALVGTLLTAMRGACAFSPLRRVTFAAGAACLAALPITNITTNVTGIFMWIMFALTMAMAGSHANTIAPSGGAIPIRRLEPAPSN